MEADAGLVQEIRRRLNAMPRRDCPVPRRAIVAGALSGAVLGLMGGAAWADDALSAEAIRIPTENGDIGGFRAVPARTGPFASVVVVGDEAGLPDWVAALCRRLAGSGYLAIGVDAWGGPEPTDATVMRRIDAAFLMARQHSGDPGRQALVGFGRGGRVTWLYDALGSGLRAAVAWGGVISGPTSEGSPKTPLEVAGQLKAPLLGFYGQDDAGNPRSVLLKAEAAAGRQAELVMYDGVQADFAVDGRPTYDKAAAMDGWQKMLAWFKRYGVA